MFKISIQQAAAAAVLAAGATAFLTVADGRAAFPADGAAELRGAVDRDGLPVPAERVRVAHEGASDAPLAKADRVTGAGECTGQTWPYVAPKCLVSKTGRPVREPVRTITVEIRTGEGQSTLVRRRADDVRMAGN